MMHFDARLRRKSGLGAALVAVILVTASCAQIEPMDYTEIHDIQPGPGLLSGKDGAFVLYGD